MNDVNLCSQSHCSAKRKRKLIIVLVVLGGFVLILLGGFVLLFLHNFIPQDRFPF